MYEPGREPTFAAEGLGESARLVADCSGRLARAIPGKGAHGLLIKTLFQTGARVSEFTGIRVEDLFFDELMILINKGKGGKSRYVPILAELAQEPQTHLGDREAGCYRLALTQ